MDTWVATGSCKDLGDQILEGRHKKKQHQLCQAVNAKYS